jgi:hypothetical protein
MSPDQPDFVFADEQDGVVAIKHGPEILFASLYWRAGYAINFLARTHYLTPSYQQVAVVHEDVIYQPSGQIYVRPDWINFGFGTGGVNIGYPPDLHQAYAGEKMPVAAVPPGVDYRVGEESYWSGKGEFYTLRYGPYLIGMNTTHDKTYELTIPVDVTMARQLPAGQKVSPHGEVGVGPSSTLVFYLGGD